jgi:type IV secretion system protein VirD4
VKRVLIASAAVPLTIAAGAVWIALSSLAYCLLVRRPDLFVFPYDQWIEVLPWWRQTKMMTIYVSFSGAVPAFLTMLILKVWVTRRNKKKRHRLRKPMFGGLRPSEQGSTDNHGHARWLTMKEAQQLFPGPSPVYGGVVVGEAYRVDEDCTKRFNSWDRSTWGKGGTVPLLIDPCTSGPGHSILYVGSNGFKTMCAVSTVLHWTGSSVVLDPAREIGDMVRAAQEGRQGKAVHVLDTTRPEDAERWGFNALDWLVDSANLEEDIFTVVSWIFSPAGGGKEEDKFFTPYAKNLVACLMADMLTDDDPIAPKTLATLRAGITRPQEEFKDLLRGIHHHSNSMFARQLAGTLMDSKAEKQFEGIYGTAVNETNWLGVPSNAELVSGDAFTTSDIIDGNTTVFVQIPMDGLGSFPGLARVIIGSLMKAVYRAEGAINGRVLYLLDEAARLGYMRIIEEARDAGRKYGITLQLLYQTVAQMTDQWGPTGKEKWYGTVSWRGYAAVRHLQTAEELSKECGHCGVMASSEGDSRGKQGRFMFVSSMSLGTSTTEHEIKRPLMYPQEFMQDCRTDEIFVVGTGWSPLRCGRALYFRRPELVAQVEASKYVEKAA